MTDLSFRKRWLALYVLCLADLMIVLDGPMHVPAVESD